MFNNFSFEKRVIIEIRWKNTVEPDRPQTKIRRMRIACLIPKAKNTHSVYIVLITFSMATLVARTRLNVTLYVHCLSRFSVK